VAAVSQQCLQCLVALLQRVLTFLLLHLVQVSEGMMSGRLSSVVLHR